MVRWNPRWLRSAPLRPLVALAGLVGGLMVGAGWSWWRGSPVEERIVAAVRAGFLGSVLGMAVILADGVGRDEEGRFTTRGWALIVAVAALAFGLLAFVLGD